MSRASQRRSAPCAGDDIPAKQKIASFACNRPMIPGINPRTPTSSQLGISDMLGDSGNKQRYVAVRVPLGNSALQTLNKPSQA